MGAADGRASLHRVEPAEMDRIAFAAQERHRLVQRQADDVGIRADDFHDKGSGNPLRGVAAGLAAPFAGGEVGLDVFVRQALEAHPRLHVTLAEGLLRRHQAYGGMDAVVAAGQKPQALRRVVEQFRLGQDAAADGDHGVGGEDEGALELLIELHHGERRLGLAARQPGGAGARQLAPLRRLIDVGRAQRVGLNAGLVDQRQPARRAGGEHEFGAADHGRALR